MAYAQKIMGIDVLFPYEKPYKSQEVVMEKTIKGIASNHNALIESPTGTGKTLALLSASLAYQHVDPKLDSIIYTSRTHTQLKQVISEYKRLPYKVQMTVLASRKRLCINDEVRESPNTDINCYILTHPKTVNGVTQEQCPYFVHAQVEKAPRSLTIEGDLPKFDLEELFQYGKRHAACPYYLAKNLKSSAKIIFSPYNYYLDTIFSSEFLTNSILIFDEAHNIENAARNIATFKMPFELLTRINISAKQIAERKSDRFGVKIYNNMIKLTNSFLEFMLQQWEYYLKRKQVEGKTHIAYHNLSHIIGPDVSALGHDFVDYSNPEVATPTNSILYDPPELITFASQLGKCLKLITPQKQESFVYIFVPGENINASSFEISCLDPSVVFEQAGKSAKSIILASGTLSPQQSFESELGLPFPIKASVPHVISPDQVKLYQIVGTNGRRMTSLFDEMEKRGKQILLDFGRGVLSIVKNTDGGVLVFMPSYAVREKMMKVWRKAGIAEQIYKERWIFNEEQGKDMKKVISDYKNCKGRAVLFAICKGSIGEGIDFSDYHARAVVCFGIPYPPSKEQEIIQKRLFNNKNRPKYNGKLWYNGQGMRTLFQVLGRVIRHSQDYGALFVFEDRLHPQRDFPSWMTRNIEQTYKTADEAINDFILFQQKMKSMFDGKQEIDYNQSTPNYIPSALVNTQKPQNQSLDQKGTSLLSSDDQKPLNQNSIVTQYISDQIRSCSNQAPYMSTPIVREHPVPPPPPKYNQQNTAVENKQSPKTENKNIFGKFYDLCKSLLGTTQENNNNNNNNQENEELVEQNVEESPEPEREQESRIVDVIDLVSSSDDSDEPIYIGDEEEDEPKIEQSVPEKKPKPYPLDHVPTTLETIRNSYLPTLTNIPWFAELSTSFGFQELLAQDDFKYAFFDSDFIDSLERPEIRREIMEGKMPSSIPNFVKDLEPQKLEIPLRFVKNNNSTPVKAEPPVKNSNRVAKLEMPPKSDVKSVKTETKPIKPVTPVKSEVKPEPKPVKTETKIIHVKNETIKPTTPVKSEVKTETKIVKAETPVKSEFKPIKSETKIVKVEPKHVKAETTPVKAETKPKIDPKIIHFKNEIKNVKSEVKQENALTIVAPVESKPLSSVIIPITNPDPQTKFEQIKKDHNITPSQIHQISSSTVVARPPSNPSLLPQQPTTRRITPETHQKTTVSQQNVQQRYTSNSQAFNPQQNYVSQSNNTQIYLYNQQNYPMQQNQPFIPQQQPQAINGYYPYYNYNQFNPYLQRPQPVPPPYSPFAPRNPEVIAPPLTNNTPNTTTNDTNKKYDLTICCINCKCQLADIKSIKECEFKTPRKIGYMVLVGVSKPPVVFQVSRSNMANSNLAIGKDEYSNDDKCAYNKVYCKCGMLLGASIKAASKKDFNDVESVMFLASKITVNMCGKLVSLTALNEV
ncbi:helicase, putative [Trichomonas vaginalis G3]|uniref:Helicase, putative n=1 Tax=Trichomonas vaginalis (strain ATCC PRA-98 / G3) TaxID=412133 RepID=A2DDD4_TRIV3|nr:DNA repair DEAD helicase RAD3/XP-D subfamily member family [Trichomonas vaginalis G3]EAY21613.1 helicase, putative [Trichomonas vaginalis G3]KAI5489711.1 DNA repair DEAD helicase RAD3/XP-D subfamily member family [Trichomonas vaginalis G3]|eukprot:XP_001582599.1 helicase [Trichomonas vaginalis G3]